jgi:hypothetical protein
MGESTCKLPFELDCPNGGNKIVALKNNPRKNVA